MENDRNEQFELTLIRPSLDIGDYRFEAAVEMELGNGLQQSSALDGDHEQVGSDINSSRTLGSADDQSIVQATVSVDATEEVQRPSGPFSWMRKASSSNPALYNHKDRIYTDKRKSQI
jgi:hypothetical protein